MPREAEVLRVLRNESEMHAFLLVYHERVHQIVFVEADGSAADGADEAALQQPDVVVVDVDVGEYVREDSPQHVSGVEELLDAGRIHTFDNSLFALGVFAENSLAGRLFDRDGQNHLAGLGRYFHLVFEERELFVDAFLHFVGGDIVERHFHFLVFLILVVVVLFQFQRLFVFDDLLHELHGGVVLA